MGHGHERFEANNLVVRFALGSAMTLPVAVCGAASNFHKTLYQRLGDLHPSFASRNRGTPRPLDSQFPGLWQVLEV